MHRKHFMVIFSVLNLKSVKINPICDNFENKHPISKKIKSCQRLSLFENFSKYLANNVCFQILPLGFFFMVTVISLILMKKIWETDTFPLCFVNADIHPQIFIWFTTVYNDVVVHVIQDLQLEKCFFLSNNFFPLFCFYFMFTYVK